MKRFLNKDYQFILEEIRNKEKTGHWMWWGFPIFKYSWGEIKVSTTTLYYSLVNAHEAREYVEKNHLYYYEAIDYLSLYTSIELRKFFGPDIDKFISHVHSFVIYQKDINMDKKTFRNLLIIFCRLVPCTLIESIRHEKNLAIY